VFTLGVDANTPDSQSYLLISPDDQLLVHKDNSVYLFTFEEVKRVQVNVVQHYPLNSATTILLCIPPLHIPSEWCWVTLRQLLGMVAEQAFQLAGRAFQLMGWFKNHQYCGRCGGRTELCHNEPRLICHHCHLDCYPRISPCVIGLIVKGDSCLLARGERHPEGLYSTLAGFIEVGENAEQAFSREVKEEVGLDVSDIRYLHSQPWPFPGQLMLGFEAKFRAGDICVDNDEIIDAQWFHYENLPRIPLEATISGRIIRQFVQRKVAEKSN